MTQSPYTPTVETEHSLTQRMSMVLELYSSGWGGGSQKSPSPMARRKRKEGGRLKEWYRYSRGVYKGAGQTVQWVKHLFLDP